MAVILGCNSGIYNDDPGNDFSSKVSQPPVLGCRGYRDNVIIDPTMVPKSFGDIAGVKMLMSIRPHPDYFLSSGSHYNGNYKGSPVGPQIEDAINAFLQDGCTTYGAAGLAPQLSTWHEAGNLYQKGTDSNGMSWGTYLTASKVRSVHVKMWNMVQAVNANNPGAGIGYGPIMYYTGSSGSRDLSQMEQWFPSSSYPMDWYGVDTYDNNDQDLSDITKVTNYLDPFRTFVQGLSGLTNPKIDVPECNSGTEGNRPWLFKNVANWLYNHGGKRLYTFYKCGGASGGCWLPGDTSTINALNYIQNNYGS